MDLDANIYMYMDVYVNMYMDMHLYVDPSRWCTTLPTATQTIHDSKQISSASYIYIERERYNKTTKKHVFCFYGIVEFSGKHQVRRHLPPHFIFVNVRAARPRPRVRSWGATAPQTFRNTGGLLPPGHPAIARKYFSASGIVFHVSTTNYNLVHHAERSMHTDVYMDMCVDMNMDMYMDLDREIYAYGCVCEYIYIYMCLWTCIWICIWIWNRIWMRIWICIWVSSCVMVPSFGSPGRAIVTSGLK